MACAVLVAVTLFGGAGLASAAVDKNGLHQEMLSLAQQMLSLGSQVRTNPQAAASYAAAESRYRQISASLGGDDPGHVLSGAVNAKARRPHLKVRKGSLPPPGGCSTTTTNFTNSTPVAISATGTPVVTSTIVVSGVGPFLYDLNVTTFLQHSFSSDLDVTITSPAGTVVTLTTDNGSTFDDVFNGTVWDDDADPGTQVPYTADNNLVVEHTYANLTLASPLVPEEPLGAFIGENPNGTWTITVSDDSNLDGGSLNSWSLAVTTLASVPTITTLPTATQSTPVAISATGTPVVTSTIVVAGAGSILDVNATTFLQHSFSSDLDVTLMSPAGTVVTLTTDNGSTFDDVFNGTVWDDDADPGTQVPYTADNNLVIEHTYANLTLASPLVPEEPLAAFTGEDPNGTWTLTISDDSNLDGGSLNSWSLDIQTFVCSGAASADLSITKTDGVASATPGGTTTYTITAANAGPSAANPATVTDTFPAACTSVSYTSTAAGGATGNTASGSGNINDTALNLPAGSSVTYSATCSINPAATGTLVNTATISSAVTDPNPANNSATDTDSLVIATSADLSITKTDGVASATPGSTTTYTITAANAGTAAANPATVTDSFPAACTSVSYTSSATGGATGNTASGSGNINDTALNLPAGSSVTYTAICSIDPAATGSLTNTATISSAVTDPNPANNSATDTDSLVPSADLSLTKVLTTTGTIHVGDNVTFALTVTNNGPSNATNVVVTDTLPAGLTYVSNSCGASFASPTLTWTIPALASGASASCNLTVMVNQPGTFVNVASATATQSDPTPANNAATAAGSTAAEIPTLDTLGLVALALLLAASAAIALRRRRRA
ncbi:MAG TPA: proprotein convertase P-domain-containing protein [Thermoanaerobaculia bacterium]|nr:proprotein convertase P-domain-containing protein [Thermoanaerobaculia bacterium]